MKGYTLHINFKADEDADALVKAFELVLAAFIVRESTVDFDTWDVSGADHTGAQDWSRIVPRTAVAA